MWIDTHAHLNDGCFKGQLSAVLERALAARVGKVLVVGIDAESSARAVELAQRYQPLFAVVGIQPNCLADVREGDWDQILSMTRAPKVVGIGETGLDHYWQRVPIEPQREYFSRHLELANERNLPVVIHCRDAGVDVVAVLTEFSQRTGRPIPGVMHSFTGDPASARACLDLGLHLSFAGMLTYKKCGLLREVAAEVPLHRLLVETDSPYLAPEPLRGKPNEPAYVVYTGARLAELKGITAEQLADATTANASRLFALPATQA